MWFALNILTDEFEEVPEFVSNEEFALHKPNKPPFQDHTMKTRSLWEHKRQQYVIWYKSGNIFMIYVSECRAKLRREDPDAQFSLMDVGHEIDACTVNTAAYKKKRNELRYKGGNVPKAGDPRPGEATEVSDPTPPAAASTSSAAPGAPQPSSQSIKRKSSETNPTNPTKRPKLPNSSGGNTKARILAAAGAAAGGAATKGEGNAPAAAAPAIPDVDEPATTSQAHSNDESREYGGGGDALPSTAAAAVVTEATEAAASTSAPGNPLSSEHYEERISQLTKELDNSKRIHKNALQRHKNERNKKAEELQEKEKELQLTKMELSASIQQQNVNSTRQSYLDAQEQKVDPIEVCEKLMDKCIASLKELRVVAEKVVDDELSTIAEKSDCDTKGWFFYEDMQSNQWIPIVDDAIITKLRQLLAKETDQAFYTIGSETYVATRASSPPNMIDQKNQVTNNIRKIRLGPMDKAAKMDMVNYTALQKLLASHATCDLTDLPTNVRYDVDVSHCKSRKLSELAELFSSCGSGFKYCVKAGTKPRDRKHKHYGSWTSGGWDFNSELFVKPMAIANWLRIAESRGMKFGRLILHGAHHTTFEKIKADPHGFDSQYSGTNGQAFGNGFYFGTSDHCSVGYNTSDFPSGTGIMALMMTNDEVGWQHHAERVDSSKSLIRTKSGSYTYKKDKDVPDARYKRPYSTFKFGNTNQELDNAVVVHDSNYCLVLGLVHAFCPDSGWLKLP